MSVVGPRPGKSSMVSTSRVSTASSARFHAADDPSRSRFCSRRCRASIVAFCSCTPHRAACVAKCVARLEAESSQEQRRLGAHPAQLLRVGRLLQHNDALGNHEDCRTKSQFLRRIAQRDRWRRHRWAQCGAKAATQIPRLMPTAELDRSMAWRTYTYMNTTRT